MTGENLDLEELVLRPGTYFNPNTEVVIIVDDSASIDQEVFDLDTLDSDWVHVSDDVPVDEHALEQSIEAFQTSYHPVSRDAVDATSADHGDDEIHPDEELDDLEPDPEFDENG